MSLNLHVICLKSECSTGSLSCDATFTKYLLKIFAISFSSETKPTDHCLLAQYSVLCSSFTRCPKLLEAFPDCARVVLTLLKFSLIISYAHVNLCHFFSSSWCQGLAATSSCVSSWTFSVYRFYTYERRSDKRDPEGIKLKIKVLRQNRTGFD